MYCLPNSFFVRICSVVYRCVVPVFVFCSFQRCWLPVLILWLFDSVRTLSICVGGWVAFICTGFMPFL